MSISPVKRSWFSRINPFARHVERTPVRRPAASAKDVDKAVKAARKALESGPWKTMDAADRQPRELQA